MIVGASGGIGSYLTMRFDEVSNELFLTYNTSKNKIYLPKKANSTIFKSDFTKEEDAIKVYSEIKSLDVLINTLGHVDNELIVRMKECQWDNVIESNLKTIFLSCKYGLNKIVENGHIINISSILGSTGMIGATNYATAKGGVEAFTKSLALECLHRKRIFVNALALGYFKIGMGLNLSKKIVETVKSKILLNEFGDPEEIFKAIKYIISSKYLVGQVLHINGGLRL